MSTKYCKTYKYEGVRHIIIKELKEDYAFGLTTDEMMALFSKKNHEMVRFVLSILFSNQIIEFCQTDGRWRLFIPYEWFGDDIKKDKYMSHYNKRLYGKLNKEYREGE